MKFRIFNYTVQINKVQEKETENKPEIQQIEVDEHFDAFDKEYGFILKYGLDTVERYNMAKEYWLNHLQGSS